MNVLVLESESGAADRVVAELEEAGHTVLRCHDPHRPAFPCRGLTEAGCPIADEWVDVAVTVRARPSSRPAPLEDGILCALRARVPLVVGGRVSMNPFEEYAAAVVEHHDIVAAIEEVLARPSADHTRIADNTLERALGRRVSSSTTVSAKAVARREGDRLRVHLELPTGLTRAVESAAVTEVVAALSEYDKHASGIDVSVTRGEATIPA